MSFFRSLLRDSRGELVLAAVSSLIGGAAGSGAIALIHRSLRGDAPQVVALLYMGVIVTSVVGSLVSSRVLVTVGNRAATRVRLRLARRVLATPLARIERIGSAPLMATLSEDVATLSALMWYLPDTLVQSCVIVGALGYLLYLSPVLTLIVAVAIAFGIGGFYWIKVQTVPAFVHARLQQDALHKSTIMLIEGLKELQLNDRRREVFLREVLDVSALSYEKQSIRAMQIQNLSHQYISLLSYAIIGVLLFISSERLGLGRDIVRGAVLTIVFLTSPLANVLNFIPAWTRTKVALAKIDSLALAEAGPDDRVAEPAAAPFESLSLAAVSHRYAGDRENQTFVLGPIDFTLHKGELVFLVGGNGSGKTTLAKLLVGLYDPEQGALHLNSRPVGPADVARYRSQFTAIFADPYLFDRLMTGDGQALSERANEYLVRLQLEHKVKVTDAVFSTLALSKGQRKRLALVAAYLEDRPVYVFDEWAADQDPAFKEVFYRRLLPELKAMGKTVLAITHDDQYFHLADRVLKLSDGKLVPIDAPRV